MTNVVFRLHELFFRLHTKTIITNISRSTLDASQVHSNSISVSDSGSLDLSRHYNCKYTTTHPENFLESPRTF